MNSLSPLFVYPSESFQKTTSESENEDQIRSVETFSIGETTPQPEDITKNTKKIKIWAEDLIIKGQLKAKDIQLFVFNLVGADNPQLIVINLIT